MRGSVGISATAAGFVRAWPRVGTRATGLLSSYRFLLTATLAVSCADLAGTLNRGWYPWDDGALGQMAERTLAGELPHRDFVDAYSGALTFFDAGVFWLLGTDLIWLRVAMIPFFAGFVAAIFYIASRFVPPLIAALVAVTAVVWSVPNYPAAMPSWYNLFFATLGVAAVVRYLETEKRRWLWLGGLAGGFSVAVKIIGVYYILAVVLFLVFREQQRVRGREAAPRSARLTESAWVFVASAASVAFVAAVLASRLRAAEFVAFVVPVAAIAAAIAATEMLIEGRNSLRRAASEIGPFVAGVLVPVLALMIPYVVTGSVDKFVNDVLVAPHSRLQFTAMPPPSPLWLLAAAPLALAAVVPILPPRFRRFALALVGAFYALVLVLPTRTIAILGFLTPLRESVPILSVAAAVLLVRSVKTHPKRDVRSRELLALMMFVAAFTSLVQFPFAAPIYFLYALPLVALAALALISHLNQTRSRLALVVVSAYLAAGLVHLNASVLGIIHFASGSHGQLALLDASRARIYVPARDVSTYRRVAQLLRIHAQGGYIFAGPDSPEVYYLTDLRNPTPLIYDFLTPPSERDSSINEAVVQHHVTAVALNEKPPYSPPLASQLRRHLEQIYPDHVRVGSFDVRWRE
jgi:hypothetical protein